MNNYPKFQYSRFIGEDQIVVRSEDKGEFEKLVEFVKGFGKEPVVTKGYASTGNPPVTADDFENKHICPEHNVQMKEGVSKTKFEQDGKTPKKYWSHVKKEGDKWIWCFGKGWK